MAELRLPQMGFETLGQLPQIYRKAQAEEQRKQTLANLGQGGEVDATALLKSGDLSLAQLGIGLQNRSADDAWRRQESERAQKNADRSFGLQAQTAARASEGPEVKASARAKIAQQYGIAPGTPEFMAFVLNGELPAAGGAGVYGTPIYGVKNGKTVLGAIGKDGQFHEIDTRGIEPTPGGIKPLDTGAGFAPFDPRRGGVVGPTVPKTGEVSKDYAPTIGPNGAVSAAPIPGTPAAQKIEETEAKRAASAETTAASAGSVKNIISDVRKRVEGAPAYNPAVGFGAETAARVAGSNASDTAELIKTVTANIGFDRLQRMRDESPTGGALGQVAVQELESLKKTIASLAQRQSKPQFLENLKRVEDQYDRIIKKAQAYPNASKHGFTPGGGPKKRLRFNPATGDFE